MIKEADSTLVKRRSDINIILRLYLTRKCPRQTKRLHGNNENKNKFLEIIQIYKITVPMWFTWSDKSTHIKKANSSSILYHSRQCSE